MCFHIIFYHLFSFSPSVIYYRINRWEKTQQKARGRRGKDHISAKKKKKDTSIPFQLGLFLGRGPRDQDRGRVRVWEGDFYIEHLSKKRHFQGCPTVADCLPSADSWFPGMSLILFCFLLPQELTFRNISEEKNSMLKLSNIMSVHISYANILPTVL